MKPNNINKFSLSETEKRDFFKVPENYFIEFPETLAEKIKSKQTKVFYIDWLYVGGIAASLVLLLALILYNPGEPSIHQTYAQLINEIPDSEIADYLLYSDLETDEIITEFATTGEALFLNEMTLTDLELQEDEVDALLDFYEINENKPN